MIQVNQLNNQMKKICVIGLGHVGLPLACTLAICGFEVHGYDNDQHVISSLKSGKQLNVEKSLEKLVLQAQSHSLNFSTSPVSGDIYVIAVPTHLGKDNNGDLSHVYAAIDSIKPMLRPRNLILIESTCPIGTTDQIAQMLDDIYVAYCPERVLPGNILYELIHNERVVGGVDKTSTQLAVAFYQSFVKGKVHATDARTAEAVKLAENTYRDVNIAFANELSMIADQVNLDVNQIIRLANRHPRVNILEPGSGVGGHCIAIDPWFLAAAAPDYSLLTVQARRVNIKKTEWVIQKIRDAIKKYDAKSIACLGLTYKPDVGDTRESSSLLIAKTLEKEITVHSVDPYVNHTKPLKEAIKMADIVIGLVAHREFQNLPAEQMHGKIVLDFGRVFK